LTRRPRHDLLRAIDADEVLMKAVDGLHAAGGRRTALTVDGRPVHGAGVFAGLARSRRLSRRPVARRALRRLLYRRPNRADLGLTNGQTTALEQLNLEATATAVLDCTVRAVCANRAIRRPARLKGSSSTSAASARRVSE
jgi:hypothetical protein